MTAMLTTTRGTVYVDNGRHTYTAFRPEGRHRDRIGNVRRDAEDAGRVAIATLSTAGAGLVVTVAGTTSAIAQAITAGVWLTLMAGTVGAILLLMERYINMRAARLEKIASGRTSDGVGDPASTVVPEQEHLDAITDGPIPLREPGDGVSANTLYLSRASTDEGDHGPARVAYGTTPIQRARVRSRWGGSSRQRLAMVRSSTGPHGFPKFVPAKPMNFSSQDCDGNPRREGRE